MEIPIRYPIDHRVLFKALTCIKIENKTLYIAMLFSYFLGLRATEVVSLSWNDLNIERKTVTYSNKKNGRIVKLIPEKLIKELIIFKREKEPKEAGPIFLRSNILRISVRMMAKKLHDILEKHTLDHFYFSDLYKLHKELLIKDLFYVKTIGLPSIHPVDSKHINYYLYNNYKQKYKILDDYLFRI